MQPAIKTKVHRPISKCTNKLEVKNQNQSIKRVAKKTHNKSMRSRLMSPICELCMFSWRDDEE